MDFRTVRLPEDFMGKVDKASRRFRVSRGKLIARLCDDRVTEILESEEFTLPAVVFRAVG